MSCHEALALFSALVDGALSPAEESRLRAHVAGCAECARELAAFERTVHMLRAAEPARAPAGFVDRVLAAAAPVPWYRRLARTLLVPLPAKLPLEAAATVLVGVLVVTVFRHTPELNQAARDLPPAPSVSRDTPASTAAATTAAVTASAPPGAEVVSAPSESASDRTLLSRAAPSGAGSMGERDARERASAPRSGEALRDADAPRDPAAGRDAGGASRLPQSPREAPATSPAAPTTSAEEKMQNAKQAVVPEFRREAASAARPAPAATPTEPRRDAQLARESAEAESSRGAAPAAVPSPRPSAPPAPGAPESRPPAAPAPAAPMTAPSAPPAMGPSGRLRSAAPDAAATLQKTSVAADVVGRLVVADRAASRRAVGDLAARLGGADVTVGPAGETALVEIVIPRRAWDDLVRELARLGRFTPERQPAELPADVRVAIRLEQSR